MKRASLSLTDLGQSRRGWSDHFPSSHCMRRYSLISEADEGDDEDVEEESSSEEESEGGPEESSEDELEYPPEEGSEGSLLSSCEGKPKTVARI